jgi:glycogen(starch) synthase
MRLLIIDREFPPNPHGGIGAYDSTVARLLGQAGHFVAVLTCASNRSFSITEEPYGVLISAPCKLVPSKIGAVVRWFEQLVLGWQLARYIPALIRQYKINLMEIPSAGGYNVFAVWRKHRSIPAVTRFHGSLGKIPAEDGALRALAQELHLEGLASLRNKIARVVNSPLWQIERAQLMASDQITCPSEFSRQWLMSNAGIDAACLRLIPNGVDLKGLSAHQLSSRPRNKEVFFIGRCSIPKGAGVLAKAIPRILSDVPDARFFIAGPHMDSAIAGLFRNLQEKYPGRIELPGRVPHDDLMPLMARGYLLVHPTFYETSSIGAMEAMALRLPVVASRTGPLPEIVEDGKTGLLFDPGSAEQLAEAVVRLLSAGDDAIEAMRQACVAKIAKHYDFNNIGAQLISFYRQVAGDQ